MADQVATQKDIQELTKAINALVTPTKDLVKKQGVSPNQAPLQNVGAKETDRFIRKEDPAKKYYKDSVATLKDILKVNKEILKNSMQKFSTGLGTLLALGGLLGFLLTGKKELLFATVKGLEKAFIMPMTKVFDKFVQKVAGFLLKEGKGLLKGFGGLAKSLFGAGKAGAKMAAKEGAEIAGKAGAKMAAKEGAEIAGKVGAKGLVKGGAKLGLKALSKVPILGVILGPVVGIIFALERWKKKDYVGALLEIASGLTSMIPGLGIPLSLAIDVFLAFRDLKSKPEDIKKQNAGVKKGMTKISDTVLDGLPVIGTIRAFNRMKTKWAKKDYVGAFGEAGMAVGSLIPGFGMTLSIVKSIYESFQKKDESTGGGGGAGAGGVGEVPMAGDADVENLMTKSKTNISEPVAFKPSKYSVPLSPEAFMAQRQYPPSDATMTQGSKGSPFYFYKNSTLNGMIPSVKERFEKMGKDYFALTGQKLQINSGYRSYEEQKKLYLKYKSEGREKYASNPDDPATGLPRKRPTSHMRGVSIDVNSGPADYLEGSGLLDKYGFHRPLMQLAGQPQSIKEPWHIQSKSEPIGDAPTITNSSAIDSKNYIGNMEKLSGAKSNEGIKELIDVTRECNKLLIKTIQGQKITSKQSLSVNSAG